MSKIDKFNRAQKAKNNEYYTKYEDVKFFVENSQIKDYLADKVVYCPCDTENSNIYKYLIDNKAALKIKEVLRSDDDYYSHQDLYNKCDVVFTNPPFTGIAKWLLWLDGQGKKYISWFPMMGLYGWAPGRKNKDVCEKTKFIGQSGGGSWGHGSQAGNFFTKEKDHSIFDTPNGEVGVAILIISNDKYFDNFEYIGNAFSKPFDKVKDKLFWFNDGYEVCMSRYIPNDYFDGYLYIPLTAYIGKQRFFDYVEATCVIGKDGKLRPRIKVKLKKDEINKIKQE